MTFQPGQSGNPGGRKPKSAEERELEEIAKANSPDALATLIAIHKNPKMPPAARVTAATAIMDRGHGKPTQPIEADVRETFVVARTPWEAAAWLAQSETEQSETTAHYARRLVAAIRPAAPARHLSSA